MVHLQVEKSLKVAEQLIRAMPVELDNSAEELAQALVHVRSGANAVEGEEEKLENQRHGALVALLACAPLSSIVIVTQEIFSPHLDISQRLLLLDAMAGTFFRCHSLQQSPKVSASDCST